MKKYSDDKTFLGEHLNIVELADGERKAILAGGLQGRVLTSTGGGDRSFGWINYKLIESGATVPHCNNYGGEDRFWLGPEGGQFSIFFPQGTDFGFDDWQTPAEIDTAAWETGSVTEKEAVFFKEFGLTNTSGTRLELRTDRRVALLSDGGIEKALGVKLPREVEAVGFSSENKLTNTGVSAWTKETGMLSIWILGQFIPSDGNTIIIPLRQAAGEKINDSYFGRIGADRLCERDGVLLFRGDGRKRGKIGTPPTMTVPVVGAWDSVNGVLTIVKFSFDPSRHAYVNSMWEHQAEPFRGDVMNSYNDGPLEDGSIMGPFYELESSSPAAGLAPGESITHTHSTFHFTGEFSTLNGIAQKLLGINLDDI